MKILSPPPTEPVVGRVYTGLCTDFGGCGCWFECEPGETRRAFSWRMLGYYHHAHCPACGRWQWLMPKDVRRRPDGTTYRTDAGSRPAR